MPAVQPPPPPAQAHFTFAENDAARFWAFHQENPHVYVALRRFALEAIATTHRRRLSINLLFERLRWYTEIETKGDPFKVRREARGER